MSGRLKWAAVWGLCFLLSIVIQQSALRALHMLRPTDQPGLSFNFFVFSIVMLTFFATFALHIRGYAYLGQKYDLPMLRWSAYGFILSLAALCIGNLVDVYNEHESAGADDVRIAAFIGAAITFCIAGFVAIGFGTLPLRDRLVLVAKVPSIVGTLIFMYELYILVSAFFGLGLPQFLGSLIWLPIPEALFVIAGTALFFRAAADCR